MSFDSSGTWRERKTIFVGADSERTVFSRTPSCDAAADTGSPAQCDEADDGPPHASPEPHTPHAPHAAATADAPSEGPPPDPDPEEPAIAGRFVVVKPVPSGREADCAIGRDLLDPSRRVFIKRYRPERTGARFVAKRVALRRRFLSLDHDNCVRMLALEPPEAGRPLTEVYEYLEGEELSATLARSRRPDDAFIRLALEQIAAGLDAFQRTVSSAHRDLKPDNVMVTVRDGGVRFVICDYGTATATDIAGVTNFEGTRDYAPPESQRPEYLRDEQLKAFDWWSVGRILQEMVDGQRVKQSIAANLGDRIEDEDAADAIFSAIMFGRGHGYGVRPGMVEWSDPAWRAPLRGLLTSNRRLRWGYEQIRAWLRGATTVDEYDAEDDLARFSYRGKAYEAADAARLLANAENWDDAIEQVVRRTGIVGYARHAGNLRVARELERIFEMHRDIAPQDPKIADDLTVALALAAIGRAKGMPVTIRGTVVGRATLEGYALEDREEALAAISHPRFLDRLEAISPIQHAELQALHARIAAMRAQLVRFGESAAVLARSRAKLARYLFLPEERLRVRVGAARRTYATSENRELATAMGTVERASADELAALAYAFESEGGCFRFVTQATLERREVEALNRRATDLQRSFALWALAPLVAVLERLEPRRRGALLGVVGGVGWSAYLYSPLWAPSTLLRVFAVSAIVCTIVVLACTWLLRPALARFAFGRAGLGGQLPPAKRCFSDAAAVRRSVLAGGERRTLLGLLRETDARIRALAPRHAELRRVRIPVPYFAALLAGGALFALAAIPLGILSAMQLARTPAAVSTNALASRLTTAYVSGRVDGASRYARGTALADLRNAAFSHVVRRRLAEFGPFRGASEEMLDHGMPGRSIVALHFAHRRLRALLVHSRREALDFEISGIMPRR